ncbi:MBL fold metallo-hydrolase [Amphritea japonica]|uniref:Beta-lactamase domain-containing protein n=1 Tax=Amphritea japonica ATCC BAA-1530 TaxID=1278309 RepID=A0A7R6P6Y8_9GAMM|nr:MBL fold metallo-hydrolase [Amphritea japonica]BBB27084.1 beta-lactamase domain-containing protein [Amphritea japonica ATCC BAA-1530]
MKTNLPRCLTLALFALATLITAPLSANPLKLINVADNVYALIGPMEQRSPTNLANNANFGFIVSDQGVLLIDSGGTLAGAKDIESHIRTITDKPVTLVINTGGQDHRWFGNSYFSARGADTLTSMQTQTDQATRGDNQSGSTSRLTGDSWQGTTPQPAQQAITEKQSITFGVTEIQIIPVGPAHTGGETLVWLPQHKILFSGDTVYLDRMLGVGSQSQHLSWLAAFATIEALNPTTIVPGHGMPADLSKAQKETRDYLQLLRTEVAQLIEAGADMEDATLIDQSAYSYLKVYKSLHKRNALRVYEEMEWE